MIFTEAPLHGAYSIDMTRVEDERGFFARSFCAEEFARRGLATHLGQCSVSFNPRRGTLRGLHFQWEPPMGKIMRVSHGNAFLVAVDIRKGSPTLGKWFGLEVSAENRRQVWAPAGFARGFCVLSETAEIQYKCTGIYNGKAESGIRWNDTAIGIKWPLDDVIVSDKDRNAQTLTEWLLTSESDNFHYSQKLDQKYSRVWNPNPRSVLIIKLLIDY